jgi:hypothetical protein
VAYPLAFKSNEEIVFAPRLPYHQDFRYTSRDNRYSPYSLMVEESERVAYITTKHPALNQKIRAQLIAFNISWREKTIGDYQIFYDLSHLLRPEEIDPNFQP